MPKAENSFARNTFVVEKMDQISGLPQTILHDILSRLPEKDAVKTSILSKAWRETWYAYPVLSICDAQLISWTSNEWYEDFSRKRKVFVDYVKKRLLRFSDQGLAIKEFNLGVHCFNFQDMSQDMDIWMKLATECSVEVLELILLHGPKQNKDHRDLDYILKPGVLEAKSLNKLVLSGSIRVDQALLNCSIKFSSLRVLSLSFVVLGDDGAIENLISHCPLIERITLESCYVCNPLSTRELPGSWTGQLKSISMHGLQKLKEVDVQRIQEVYIDAPNLENLCYRPDDIDAPFKLNFDNCRNLRWLHLMNLQSTVIENEWFLALFSKFPLLESLKLGCCSVSERINISSAKLKYLELFRCLNLKEVIIDAPNLLLCECSDLGRNRPVISFPRSSTQLVGGEA